ncbi:DUF4232 domain-containing protein [Streptomyces sp. V2I9]|uniref:DUF4232 domain-containing protein n=1 Tax=Streptomyces sp. V2I9 TaxID=3042304 RepID=UPI00277F3210|nr:DUF4232 domain-containing protein [Streptomyces sp. V2I9]MDQ0985695.1 hypothetical protein [Streptomyces sp. V2I9]
MRTYRNRTAVLVSAATAALALSLTACNGDDGGAKSAGTTDSSAASASTAPVAKSTDTQQDGAEQSGDQDAAEQGGEGQGTVKQSGGTGQAKQRGSGTTGNTPLCTAKGLTITAERQDGPPYTHLTLSAKNTSGASCEMKEYPHIHFLDNARGIVPPVAKSKPAAPVILEPGQSAYAAVRMSEGGRKENTETVKEFTVTLKANGGGMAVVKSPAAEGLSVNPQKWATGYWTPQLRNGADEF